MSSTIAIFVTYRQIILDKDKVIGFTRHKLQKYLNFHVWYTSLRVQLILYKKLPQFKS